MLDFRCDEVSSDPTNRTRVGGFAEPETNALFLVELSEPRMTPRDDLSRSGATLRRRPDSQIRQGRLSRSSANGHLFARSTSGLRQRPSTTVECGEPLQMLRYGPSAGISATCRCDRRHGQSSRADGSRLAERGLFRTAKRVSTELGIDERGETGDLLIFSNTRADGVPIVRTRHSGAPVTSGVKYLASRWIRPRPPGPEGFGRHEVERA